MIKYKIVKLININISKKNKQIKIKIRTDMQQYQDLPYTLNGTIQLRHTTIINYHTLLQHYDPSLLQTLLSINSQMLEQPIYQFQIRMLPQCLQWKIWKNKNQIQLFLKQIGQEIQQIQVDQNNIKYLYSSLTQNMFSNSSIQAFINFLNIIGSDLYLRKTQDFLLFIEHCVGVDRWDMMIYKQMSIDKQPTMFNKFTNMFSSNKQSRQKDFFITITGDGIIKSDNHLLQSRIQLMIPFTNQLTIQCKLSTQKFITYVIQSCNHQQLAINLFNDYIKAINFIVGLRIALDQSTYSDPNHRFNSYSPVRENCATKLYVDGAEYYQDLYNQLIMAKKQVCITGWMITPYFLLKRPNSIQNKQYRLDGVLQTLAQKGVKVYIIVFMQPKMVVNNDSQHVQIYLQSLHDNIKVYRHPNGAIPILWSHHQKLVIIDQQIGFMGGLDICYGRWDYFQHRLLDPGQFWDGADYNNYRTRDITQPRNYKSTNLNKGFEIRLPWHDIALQFRGDIVLDLLRHFVQYWYFVKSQLLVDPFKTVNFLKKRYEQAFRNAISKNQRQLAQYYQVQLKKRQEVHTLGQKIKYMVNGRQERFPQLFIQTRSGKKTGNQRLQMCRSASEWSIGIRPGQHQSSIHNAYQTLIKESQNFIYIQNQFFMGLENKVVQCLAQRIIKAYHNKQQFKVIAVMPLLPAFQGNVLDSASTVLRIQLHYQYEAISRNKQTSLAARLLAKGIDMKNYVHFFGLRTSQLVQGWPKTQIIYVHSKLMIVDDKRCIIGSANINDRSLLGNRDSQLACIIQEREGNIFHLRTRIFLQHFGLNQEQTRNFTNEQVWRQILYNSQRSTKFYQRFFRCIPSDTVTTRFEYEQFTRQIQEQKANYPQPQLFVKNFVEQYVQQKKSIKGHAVDFPLSFMFDQNLRFTANQKQYFAPEMSFT